MPFDGASGLKVERLFWVTFSAVLVIVVILVVIATFTIEHGRAASTQKKRALVAHGPKRTDVFPFGVAKKIEYREVQNSSLNLWGSLAKGI